REAARIVSCHQDIAADGAFALGMLAEFEAPLAAHGAWFYKRLYWECGVIGQVLYLEAEAAGIRSTGIGCFFDDLMHRILGLRGGRFQSLYHFTVGGPVEDPRLRTEPAYAHRQG
ncbi:MAG: nitroreductase family protein, partial [Gammaproteobacteria bacterium]